MSAYLIKVAVFTCVIVAVLLWLVEKLLPDWRMGLTFGTWLLFTLPAIVLEIFGTALLHKRGAH